MKGAQKIQAGQRHENDKAAVVVVCTPSLSKTMGALHPAGALYEKPVNVKRARECHEEFVQMLERRGIEVCDVRAVLCENVQRSVGAHMELEKLAAECLTYEFEQRDDMQDINGNDGRNGEQQSAKEMTAAEQFYVSDAYKMHVIEEMSSQQLVDIVLTHPTVTVTPSPRDTGFVASYRFEPLSNIIFVRDQQITTHKGIVMARLRSSQRKREVDILEFALRKKGLDVIGRVPESGGAFLEGGDFFPAGDKLAFMGVGPRTNWKAVQYLLENDLFGCDKVAVVRDNLERKQERMHLDTVFSILSDTCCVMLDEMMGEESKTKRIVDEYVKARRPQDENTTNGDATAYGDYALRRRGIEFSRYVRDAGYHIIEVSGEEQLNYGCNVLNLGNGDVISIERHTARRIANCPHFDGTVEFLDFEGVTCMYGGVHCASQVVQRMRPN